MKRINSSRNHMNDTPEIPAFTDRTEIVRRRKAYKPLFKFRIADILHFVYYPEGDYFKYKDKMEVSKVTCGGRISNIFRDDNFMFNFEINDGTGSIRCFHKFKDDREQLITAFRKKYHKKIRFFTNKTVCDDSAVSQDATVFQTTLNSSFVKNAEKEAKESSCMLMDWYIKEILNKEKIRQIDDIIHVVGFVIERECVRKINVLEFQIIENETMHRKFLAEIDWQKRSYV